MIAALIDWEFNPYRFYNNGYTTGFVPNEIVDKCKDIIKTTTWVGDTPRFADWSILKDSTTDELWYEELVRGRMSYSHAPTAMRNLANEMIDLPFFDPMRRVFSKKQHAGYAGLRNFVPCSMGLWNRQENIPWHNDITDTSDFFILVYINDYQFWSADWKGQIRFGKRDESGSIEPLHEHYPSNGTFAVINNNNPLFHHSVVSGNEYERFTFGFRYRIE
jgi:hypothetical protein